MFCRPLLRRPQQTFIRAMHDENTQWRSTTILCVRKGNKVVIVGDGQVSNGYTVCKGNAIKVRKLAGDVIVGMAGSAGDCLTLIDHLEGFLSEASGNLTMACVNLVKAWRTEKILRRLNAQLVVADKSKTLLVSGTGDVVEPEDGLVAIGSGGLYALSAAKALVDIEGVDAEEIARKSMKIAGDLCVFTNHNLVYQVLDLDKEYTVGIFGVFFYFLPGQSLKRVNHPSSLQSIDSQTTRRKGKLVLHTTFGPLDIEFWPQQAPLAVRNFVQLCMEGYYDNTIFHRLVKDFLIQGGDPTGEGGESIYGEHFRDEYHSRLRFTHSKNKNASQFFITLDATPHLNKKNTVFGKVTGETIFNLLTVNSFKCDKNDRPKNPPKVIRAEILLPPFDDIVPRVKEVIPEVAPVKEKVAGVKNTKLLSFAIDDDEDEEEGAGEEVASVTKFKMVSSHVAIPQKKKKKKGKDNSNSEEEVKELTEDEILHAAKKNVENKKGKKSSLNRNTSTFTDDRHQKKEEEMRRVQEETQALLAELKSKKDTSKKRSREDEAKEGKALLAQRQLRYLANKRPKNIREIEADLSSFVTNLRHKTKDDDDARMREEEAEEALARAEAKEREARANELEVMKAMHQDNEGGDWKAHRLNFAKDENPIVDLNTAESYTYEDPLEIRKATEGDVMYNLHQRKLKAQKNVETW